MTSLLISQCLQNDFVRPIKRLDPLPNLLHVGFEEARRLMGENPSEGPVSKIMEWAYEQSDSDLKLIHIRDLHDGSDPKQTTHLTQFGEHCLAASDGGQFAFVPPADHGKKIKIIDSPSLNDFLDTELAQILAEAAGPELRIGVIGVWTEAKVTFLAYELRSRYPDARIAVCSALTASSSTARHFAALDQLERLLAVEVIPSLGRFISFLGGSDRDESLLSGLPETHPKVTIQDGKPLAETDHKLLRYLFRDCREVAVRPLDGGFSGNCVLGTRSIDLYGHQQVHHVVKIGPRELVGKERTAFERIESVLGNNAPRITDFADYGKRGALKYRYASMGGGFSATFQQLYMKGAPLEQVKQILDIVFLEQLGRFYAAKVRERCSLLEYYCFSSKFTLDVRSRVEAVLGKSIPAGSAELELAAGVRTSNIARFYEDDLDRLPPTSSSSAYFSYVHGDLNGANIIIDKQGNVWLIDFFHTHRGHILKDLAKLENDLLYIFTPVPDEAAFVEATRLTDQLLAVEDLGEPLGEPVNFSAPPLVRAWETVKHLRSLYPPILESDTNPLQLMIAQLRYAVHTLSFDESSKWQKRWALYAAGKLADQIKEQYQRLGPLRIDWIPLPEEQGSSLGISILPGRKDVGRDLAEDLASLKQNGITHVVCLVPEQELAAYGCETLLAAYRDNGFVLFHLPVLDQKTCSEEEMNRLAEWIDTALDSGGRVFLHCIGGLGRSGTVAACYLRHKGISAESATEQIRSSRSRRAIESARQEEFIKNYAQN